MELTPDQRQRNDEYAYSQGENYYSPTNPYFIKWVSANYDEHVQKLMAQMAESSDRPDAVNTALFQSLFQEWDATHGSHDYSPTDSRAAEQ